MTGRNGWIEKFTHQLLSCSMFKVLCIKFPLSRIKLLNTSYWWANVYWIVGPVFAAKSMKGPGFTIKRLSHGPTCTPKANGFGVPALWILVELLVDGSNDYATKTNYFSYLCRMRLPNSWEALLRSRRCLVRKGKVEKVKPKRNLENPAHLVSQV